MEKVTTADLMDDLRKVVQDTEALLRATEGQVGEKADDARRRVRGFRHVRFLSLPTVTEKG